MDSEENPFALSSLSVDFTLPVSAVFPALLTISAVAALVARTVRRSIACFVARLIGCSVIRLVRGSVRALIRSSVGFAGFVCLISHGFFLPYSAKSANFASLYNT